MSKKTRYADQNPDPFDMLRTQIEVPAWLMQRLDADAKECGQQRAALIRQILIEKYGKYHDPSPHKKIDSTERAA